MGLLGDYMPQWLPEDQDKAAAMRQGLLQFGAAMLQGRGNFGNAFGGGLAAGAQGYGNARADQSKQQLQGAQMKRWDLESQGMQAALDEPMNLARIMQGGGAPGAAPAGEAPGPGKVAPLSALPTMGQQAPQQAPKAQTRQQIAEGYRATGERLRQAGRIKEAQPYFKMADEAMPKFKEQKVATVNGKRVLVNVNDQGDTSQVDGFAPDMEKMSFQNTGGTTQALDPYTGKPVNTIQNTQTPDSKAAWSSAAASRAQADRHFNANQARENSQPRGQIVQTDQGTMLVDPRTGEARPVTAGGEALQPKLKQIPSAVSKAVLENNAALRTVDKAMKELEAYPGAFGASNYLGDSIRQRSDPKGITARAYVADIGSLKIHDRSGAAVTASETPRLMPFIPSATDTAPTIKKKLARFREEYKAIQEDINSTYSRENGYRAGGGAGKASGVDALLEKYGD